jgi:hypothetical protein
VQLVRSQEQHQEEAGERPQDCRRQGTDTAAVNCDACQQDNKSQVYLMTLVKGTSLAKQKAVPSWIAQARAPTLYVGPWHQLRVPANVVCCRIKWRRRCETIQTLLCDGMQHTNDKQFVL